MVSFTRYAKHHCLLKKWKAEATTKTKIFAWWRTLTTAQKKRLYRCYLRAKRDGLVERDYKVESVLYWSRPEQKHKMKLRARNRRAAERAGLVVKFDGTQIHHKDGNALNNHEDNLVIVSQCEHKRLHGQQCRQHALVRPR